MDLARGVGKAAGELKAVPQEFEKGLKTGEEAAAKTKVNQTTHPPTHPPTHPLTQTHPSTHLSTVFISSTHPPTHLPTHPIQADLAKEKVGAEKKE